MRDVNGWWFGLRAERIGQSRVSHGFVSRRAIGRRVASLEAPDLGTGTSRSVACSARAPSGFPAVTRSSRRRPTCAPSSTHRASSSPSRCPPSCPSRRRAEWSDDVQKERTVLFGATVVPRRKSRRDASLERWRTRSPEQLHKSAVCAISQMPREHSCHEDIFRGLRSEPRASPPTARRASPSHAR